MNSKKYKQTDEPNKEGSTRHEREIQFSNSLDQVEDRTTGYEDKADKLEH
jgi:hypothetical protein